MILEKNGIKVRADVVGNVLSFQVLEQSDEASQALKLLGLIHDKESDFTLKSNKYPSFNGNINRFFVRGSDRKNHNKEVQAEFGSSAKAEKALAALGRMLDQVITPDIKEPGGNQVRIGAAIVEAGGTSHVRFAFINSEMAKHLQLTGHDHYPDKVIDWSPVKPVFTNNRHYNEHIGQVVDVLNKSVRADEAVPAHVINPHRATPQGSKKAVKAMRELFEKAQEGGYLIEMWRVVTGLRGPDFED